MLFVTLRVIHIVLGVFWAGTIFFFVLLLEPAIRDMGPDGGKVLQALGRRGFLNIMPLAAVVTIVTGLGLYFLVGGGMETGWGGTPMGIALGVGALASIVAFLLGWFGLRANALELGRLGPSLPELQDEAERGAALARIQALKDRNRTLGRVIGALLAVAVLTMAVARHL
ncbi:MAG: hypothetical protein OEZ65_10925 [Gemmatimonadota bacterium]|nr:hypothetical protein [Gemmatimonadota bacterium]MDH5760091.1 hypothetical protein [Gemmatimonadota bacterium]